MRVVKIKRMGTRTREIRRSSRKQKIKSIQTLVTSSFDDLYDSDEYDWDPENGIMREEDYLSDAELTY
jgi:hypothetical protein